MSYVMPPQDDIDAALKVESMVTENERDLYFECMNGVSMSQRKDARSIRDGCILTGVFWRCSGKKAEEYPHKDNVNVGGGV